MFIQYNVIACQEELTKLVPGPIDHRHCWRAGGGGAESGDRVTLATGGQAFQCCCCGERSVASLARGQSCALQAGALCRADHHSGAVLHCQAVSPEQEK